MSRALARNSVLAGFLLCFAFASPVRSDYIIPDGNPNPYSATSPVIGGYVYTVTCPVAVNAIPINIPFTPVQIMNNCLAAEGSAWRVNNLNILIQGNVRKDHYGAWAETSPAFQQGAFNPPAEYHPGYGGAFIGLHYLPAPGDPQGDGIVHWFQLVHANWFPEGTVTWTAPKDAPNFKWAVDNNDNALNPFYDANFTANATDFVDIPRTNYANQSSFRAYTFMATAGPNNTINLSEQDVYWGFDDPAHSVPEPNSVTLFCLGGVALLIPACRSQKAYSRSPSRC